MSEKQVKRARFAAKHGCDRVLIIGKQRWLQADDHEADLWRYVTMMASTTGKTFNCAGIDDED